MKISVLILSALFMILLSAGARAQQEQDTTAPHIFDLGDSVYVHASAKELPSGKTYPANGLLVNTPDGFVLIDTPWTDQQTQALIDQIQKDFKKKIIFAYITHAHEDRIGGIKTLLANNIKVMSNERTSKLAPLYGYPAPGPIFSEDTVLNFKNIFLEIYYPGPGHTSDNTVVWLPQTRILFGGCIIKSIADQNMGNLAGSDIKEWPKSVQKMVDKFKDPTYVIPGHFPWAEGDVLLKHTLNLINQHGR